MQEFPKFFLEIKLSEFTNIGHKCQFIKRVNTTFIEENAGSTE